MALPNPIVDSVFAQFDRDPVEKPVEFNDEHETVKSLMGKKVAPPRWVIDKILPEGLCLLASRPKVGKSYLANNVSLAVAIGGTAIETFHTRQCGVLILDLEQSEWFCKQRWEQMLMGMAPPDNLHLRFKWPKMGEGGLERLSKWLGHNPSVKMVVIDVLSQFWPASQGKGNMNAYHAESRIMHEMLDFAVEHRIAMLLVHHTNKGQAADSLDQISGTNAMVGVPGAVWNLSRERKSREGKLYVTGRSVVECEVDLEWSPQFGNWFAKKKEMPT